MLIYLLTWVAILCLCMWWWKWWKKTKRKESKFPTLVQEAVKVKKLPYSDERVEEEYFTRIRIRDYLNQIFENNVESYVIVEPKVGSIRFTQGRVTAKVTLKDGGTEYHTFYPREWTAPLPRKISVEEQKGLASGRKLLSQVGILLDEAIDECFSRNKV